ncbi:hypothetical protein ACIBF1_35995 [Spirillospora sp. NPDC050679]
MTTRRIFGMALGALGPVLLLALLFGNQWVVEAVADSDIDRRGTLGTLLNWLQFPSWRITPTGRRGSAGYVLALDFTLLLYFAAVAGLVFAAARALDPVRGAIGALVTGWWAVLVAGGLVAIPGGYLTTMTLDYPDALRTQVLWNSIAQGLGFGLFYGWLAGLGAVVAFLLTRGGRTVGPMPQGVPQGAPSMPPPMPHPQQPMARQPVQPQPPFGQPAQPGHMLPPDHPAAMPYVPPKPTHADPPREEPKDDVPQDDVPADDATKVDGPAETDAPDADATTVDGSGERADGEDGRADGDAGERDRKEAGGAAPPPR